MNNRSVADVFDDIANLLELQKVEFKPKAYRRAAVTIRSLTDSLEHIAKTKGLTSIPTIGKALAEKISELLETGSLKYYDTLKQQLPKGLLDLFAIPHLGPKSITRLYHELGISSIPLLEKAIHAHRVASLKGFGHKTEYEILEGIALVKAGKDRLLLGVAHPFAQQLCSYLKTLSSVQHAEIVGSIARMKETTGDIDILCIAKHSSQVMDAFTSMDHVTKIIAKGHTKSSVLFHNRIQVDLRVLEKKNYGAAKQYFTGSKEHNVRLRNIAIAKGYKLSEYGLFDRKSGMLIEGATEKGIYKRLGLQWVAPELRENSREIELAQKNKLPPLIEYTDLRGDFHMHTTHSDGAHSISQMTTVAQKLKYKYIAITDHTKSTAIAHGNTEQEILAEMKEIDKINKSSSVTVFSGSEVDILSSGSLDFSNSILNKLDVVIASVHSGFKKDNTKRICTALDNRHVHCLGHMTGRLINQRNPYPIDIDTVLQKASENSVAIEINSQPMRLDANADIIRKGKEMGCVFMINSDAHSTAGLATVQYGIGTARRGWLSKKNVVNTWSLKKVEKFIAH